MSESMKAEMAPSIAGYQRAIVFVQVEIETRSSMELLRDRVMRSKWTALDWITIDLGESAPFSDMIYSFKNESLSKYIKDFGYAPDVPFTTY